MPNSVSSTGNLTTEIILEVEKEWVTLREVLNKGIHCNSLFPLQYLNKIFLSGLPMSGPVGRYTILASLVGALYDSNENPNDDIFFRVSVMKVIAKFYPKMNSKERISCYTNLISFVKMIKYM